MSSAARNFSNGSPFLASACTRFAVVLTQTNAFFCCTVAHLFCNVSLELDKADPKSIRVICRLQKHTGGDSKLTSVQSRMLQGDLNMLSEALSVPAVPVLWLFQTTRSSLSNFAECRCGNGELDTREKEKEEKLPKFEEQAIALNNFFKYVAQNV